MKAELTDKQRAVLEYIESRLTANGHPPTIREIGLKFGIRSTNGVRTHLTALIKKGYLRKERNISRGLGLTRNVATNILRVPLVGAVPAGVPIDATENIEGEIAVDATFLPKGDSFSLRVIGNSMRNAGILDGDLVLVKKQRIAQAGEIVVAIIGGEATVKRYFPEGNRIRLQPENDDFEPIYVDKKSDEFRIAGKVIGLLRRLG
jgi:repressor LexA